MNPSLLEIVKYRSVVAWAIPGHRPAIDVHAFALIVAKLCMGMLTAGCSRAALLQSKPVNSVLILIPQRSAVVLSILGPPGFQCSLP